MRSNEKCHHLTSADCGSCDEFVDVLRVKEEFGEWTARYEASYGQSVDHRVP